jgi:hypothetical protein
MFVGLANSEMKVGKSSWINPPQIPSPWMATRQRGK